MATQLAPLYLTEIAPYNLRGMFGTANQLFITIGIFMGSVFGLREILGKLLCHCVQIQDLRWKTANLITRFSYFILLGLKELPTELREPRQILSPSRSPPITHGSSSSPSSLSPLSSSLTRSCFHSELHSWLFGKSFPP